MEGVDGVGLGLLVGVDPGWWGEGGGVVGDGECPGAGVDVVVVVGAEECAVVEVGVAAVGPRG